jgi:O-phospho-L-seryl-tRNASec:L-selenocysteinyl-tRNA synthase
VWSRVDQKTCLKSIVAANLEPVVVPLVQLGDQLVTDLERLCAIIAELGPDSIACVVTTTSCFAPRACDSVCARNLCQRQAQSPARSAVAAPRQQRDACWAVCRWRT